MTVVFLIIVILMGFIFTPGQNVLDRSRKVQTKNDETQIVRAVNAYYDSSRQGSVTGGSVTWPAGRGELLRRALRGNTAIREKIITTIRRRDLLAIDLLRFCAAVDL